MAPRKVYKGKIFFFIRIVRIFYGGVSHGVSAIGRQNTDLRNANTNHINWMRRQKCEDSSILRLTFEV